MNLVLVCSDPREGASGIPDQRRDAPSLNRSCYLCPLFRDVSSRRMECNRRLGAQVHVDGLMRAFTSSEVLVASHFEYIERGRLPKQGGINRHGQLTDRIPGIPFRRVISYFLPSPA